MSNATLKVIVIDPFKQEIRHDHIPNPKVTQDYNSFNEAVYKVMSQGPIQVDIVQAAYLNTPQATQQDCILIDEEGLYKEMNKQMFFSIPGILHQPLAGIGVVTGSDDEGDTVEPSLTLDWFKQRVKFHTFQDIQRMYAR